jgi:hypothetical protein
MIANSHRTLCLALLAMALLWGSVQPVQAQTGGTCGGIAALKCPDEQACQFPVGQCNTADLAGNCVTVPSTCPERGPQVCGCNGITYANECELLKAGVREAKQGACGATEQPKDCKSDTECTEKNSFCEWRAGTCSDKLPGRCTARPEICPQSLNPVCGCDNKSYPNDCLRQAAGVSLKVTGECPSTTP